jgi:hypothetical protein
VPSLAYNLKILTQVTPINYSKKYFITLATAVNIVKLFFPLKKEHSSLFVHRVSEIENKGFDRLTPV